MNSANVNDLIDENRRLLEAFDDLRSNAQVEADCIRQDCADECKRLREELRLHEGCMTALVKAEAERDEALNERDAARQGHRLVVEQRDAARAELKRLEWSCRGGCGHRQCPRCSGYWTGYSKDSGLPLGHRANCLLFAALGEGGSDAKG